MRGNFMPLTFKSPHYNREGREEGLGTRLANCNIQNLCNRNVPKCYDRAVLLWSRPIVLATAVCRTVVIQQAVVGGGLEVLCG